VLDLAFSKGKMSGPAQKYLWSSEDKVAARELREPHKPPLHSIALAGLSIGLCAVGRAIVLS